MTLVLFPPDHQVTYLEEETDYWSSECIMRHLRSIIGTPLNNL